MPLIFMSQDNVANEYLYNKRHSSYTQIKETIQDSTGP
jgi:hypothetical protein